MSFSKALSPVFLAFLTPFVSATELKLEGGVDYSFDVLSGYEKVQGSGNVEVNHIQLENGIFNLGKAWAKPKPPPEEYETDQDLDPSYFYLPQLTVKGNVVAKSIRLESTNAHIKGDVSVLGTISDELFQTAIGDNAVTLPFGTEGLFWSASNATTTGGVTIDGNLSTSVVQNRNGVFFNSNLPEYFATLIVKGNLTADYIINDTGKGFDNMSDFMEVHGTTYVKKDFYNNGYVNLNKLIVDGQFHNGYGVYWFDGEPAEDQEAPSEHTGAVIDELTAQNIFNRSNLKVGTLTNTRDQIYNQLFGTIQVTNNWFANSTINLSGGIIDEAYLGQAHNLGINNTYNVTGGVLKVGDLRGDSTIHLSDKGKLETQLDSVFENYAGIANVEGLNTVSLSSATPESIRNTITDLFRVYVPGQVIDNVMDRVTLSGGQIVISGVNLTETQRDDLMAAFKETFFHNFQEDFSKSLAPLLRA